MFKKFLTIFVAALMCVSALSFAGTKKERKMQLPVTSEVFANDVIIPSNQAAKVSPIVVKANANPETGVTVGTGDYDYGWNSGWSQNIAQYNNGAHVHMSWHERDLSLTAPNNRRAYKYTYYNTSAGTLTQGYPRAKSVGATGFGGVDVITNGDAAGIAIMAYHTANFFAIDASPGAGTFTETAIPASYGSVLDPEVSWDATRNTILYYDTKNRTTFQILKSTDFGTTWALVDSNLLRHGPGPYRTPGSSNGSLDHPVLVAPNGNWVLVANLTGTGAIAPLGAAHPDSADLIGYYTSTNAGTSWTWTTWGKDGDALVVSAGDTVRVLFENFGQFTGVIDNSNKLHVVTNGYSLKYINDSTTQNRFYTLYRSTGMTGWKIISSTSATTGGNSPEYDSAYYVYNGNAIGNAYPTITTDGGNVVFAAWSQAMFKANNRLDTAQGFIQYELWYNTSTDGGTTWGTPTKVANSVGALFANAAKRMSASGGNRTAHLIYYADTARGNAVFSSVGVKQIPIVYRTVTVPGGTSVGDKQVAPVRFELGQNYPNPFNPSTTINFSVSAGTNASLKVYNMLGQEVATLVNGFVGAGSHSVDFNASKLSSGVYLYKLQAGNFTETKKMVLTK